MLFAAHESFHIREGWLRKGLLGIERNPALFSEAYAGDELGVGRNMVSAIRHWLQAAGLAQALAETNNGKRTVQFQQTPFAKLILKHDPYFEDDPEEAATLCGAESVDFQICRRFVALPLQTRGQPCMIVSGQETDRQKIDHNTREKSGDRLARA